MANIMSIDQLNIKIRRSLKGHNAKVRANKRDSQQKETVNTVETILNPEGVK